MNHDMRPISSYESLEPELEGILSEYRGVEQAIGQPLSHIETMAKAHLQQSSQTVSRWAWFQRRGWALGCVLAVVSVGSLFAPNLQAFNIQATPMGLVEIKRDGTSLVVTEETAVQLGDVIQTGNGASALDFATDAFSAHIEARSAFSLDGVDMVQLQEGVFMIETQQEVELLLPLVKITAPAAAVLRLDVSPTGASTIAVQSGLVSLRQTNTAFELTAGRSVRIDSDTNLTQLFADTEDVTVISRTEEQAIEQRLLLVQSRFVASLKAYSKGENREALKLQQAASDRLRSLPRMFDPLADSDSITYAGVLQRLRDADASDRVVAWASGITEALVALESEEGWARFPLPEGPDAFIEYVLLSEFFSTRAISKLSREQLLAPSVDQFVRGVQASRLRSERAYVLRSELKTIDKKSKYAILFVTALQPYLPSDLALIITEYLDRF